MPPLLSIVVPCRNDGQKLPGLLDSILAQTFRDLEVIVVDDCSSDSYMELLEAYQSKGLLIRQLPSSDRLFTKMARLKGVKNANGNIVLFADADDRLWGRDALAANIELFLKHNADLVHFPSVIIDQGGNFCCYFSCADPFAPELHGKEILAAFMQSHWEGGVIWNKLFRKQLLLDNLTGMIDNPVQQYSEDFYLNIYTMMHAAKYIGSEHVGYGFYRVPKKYPGRYIHNAMISLKMLDIVSAQMIEAGFSADLVETYRGKSCERICRFVGRVAKDIDRDENGVPTDAEVQQLLDAGDITELLKTLLLGNRINADRLFEIHKLMSAQSNVA